MSVPTIAPNIPFRRIKIVEQIVSEETRAAQLRVRPDRLYQPICHGCGLKPTGTRSWTQRWMRDLNLASALVWIRCDYRNVCCAHSQPISIEDWQLSHPYLRVMPRLARHIYQLCQVMTYCTQKQKRSRP